MRAPLQRIRLAAARLCLPKERGAGLGHRAPRSRQRTRPARQAPGQAVCSTGRRARPGAGIRLSGASRPLEQWGAAPHPGVDWAGTPAVGEGDSNKDVEFSIASAAQERLASALRGPRCHSHFRDGETEALVEGLMERRPTPSPGTCCGPSSVSCRPGHLEAGRSELSAWGRRTHTHAPPNLGENRAAWGEISASCLLPSAQSAAFSPLHGGC